MNNTRIKKMRVPVEMQQLKKSEKEHGITCFSSPESHEFTQLEACIPGPKGSAYEEGVFRLSIHFGEQYPFRPPTFKFVTPVYHPNIDNSGKICLDILRMPPTGSYNPAITLESILLSIQLLLANPNPDDPLQGDAADLYKSNKELFNKNVKDHIKKYCLSEGKDHNQKEVHVHEEYEENNEPTTEEVAKKRLKLNC